MTCQQMVVRGADGRYFSPIQWRQLEGKGEKDSSEIQEFLFLLKEGRDLTAWQSSLVLMRPGVSLLQPLEEFEFLLSLFRKQG